MLLADGVADTIASYLEAVGTIAAVALALFLQVILVRMRRPRLTVQELKNQDDEDRILLVVDPQTDPAVVHAGAEYWIRLRIYAEPKKQGATNVQLQLLRVVRPTDANNRAIVPSGPFRWSNVWRHVDTTLPNLAPGTWRRFDVLQLRWREDTKEHKLVLPILDFKNPENEQVLLSDSGDYKIDFVLAADGIDATFWRFSFHLASGKVDSPRGLVEMIERTKLEQLESGEPKSKVLREAKDSE